ADRFHLARERDVLRADGNAGCEHEENGRGDSSERRSHFTVSRRGVYTASNRSSVCRVCVTRYTHHASVLWRSTACESSITWPISLNAPLRSPCRIASALSAR